MSLRVLRREKPPPRKTERGHGRARSEGEPEHIFVCGLGVWRNLGTSQVGQAGKKAGVSGEGRERESWERARTQRTRPLTTWREEGGLGGLGGRGCPSLRGHRRKRGRAADTLCRREREAVLSLDRGGLKTLGAGLKQGDLEPRRWTWRLVHVLV